MKTNIFNVKEKKEKKIIIEEERTQNPFLIFLKRHKNFILLSILMTLFCLILVSIGIAFSLFQGSNDYDVSYIEGSETINSGNSPEIDDSDIKDELLGEVARAQGIVLLVKIIMTTKGDVIYYYTDGTTVVVQANGNIYRISTNEKGEYGISESGKIDETAKKIRVTSTTTTLGDGTNITYYSDGSAKVEYKSQTLFVRDSNNIKLDNGSSLNYLSPSGVAPVKDNNKVGETTIITFTDKTSLLIMDGKKYIINKNTSINITENNIMYNEYNSFAVVSEKNYKDGNVITHFENGSAIITDSNGNITYVKKSGDLLLKNKKLYEIIPNDYGYSITTNNTSDGKKVTYFDNGSAVIINSDGNRQYIENSDDIIFDSNNNIISNPNSSKQISKKTTTDGEKAVNFENGKSQVIRSDGSSYITDTDKLTFKPTDSDEILGGNNESSHGGPTKNPGEGIYISEAENKYNEPKNIETTKFTIKNNNTTSKVLKITIEEVSNYQKYNTSRLDPKFVKFQATIGDDYIPATQLTQNIWISNSDSTNYVVYEGETTAKETKQIALLLYVDYAELDNSQQNKGFIGTIRIYVEDEPEETES